MSTPLAERPHALYRFYDADGGLLYIGITASLPTRLDNHRGDKPWWTKVADIKIQHYSSRPEVETAERAAIIAERPIHNVTHNRPKQTPKAERLSARPRHQPILIEEPKLRRSMTYPKVGEFGPWLARHAVQRADEIGLMAREFAGLSTCRLARTPDQVEALFREAGYSWDSEELGEAKALYREELSQSGVTFERRVYSLAADIGKPWMPRQIRVERDVAAHVQLNRDFYVDHSQNRARARPPNRFIEAAKTCAWAGIQRIWAEGLWGHRTVDTHSSDRWINLYVPLPLIGEAELALLSAELDGNVTRLFGLADTLATSNHELTTTGKQS